MHKRETSHDVRNSMPSEEGSTPGSLSFAPLCPQCRWSPRLEDREGEWEEGVSHRASACLLYTEGAST